MDLEGLKVQTTSPCATSNFGSLRQKERIPTSSGYFHFSNDSSSLANVSFWFWKEVRMVQQWLSIDAGNRLIVPMPCRFVYMHPKTMTWRPFLIRDSSLRPLMSYKASVISKYQVTIFLAPVFHVCFFFKLDGCCVPYHLWKQFATSTETLIFLWILQYDHPWN